MHATLALAWSIGWWRSRESGSREAASPLRCDLPLLLPVIDVARSAVLPREDDHDADQYDPYHHDGPADPAPAPWVPMSPKHADPVRPLAQQSISLISTYNNIIHN